MSDPNIGRLLVKRYHLQELIGTGAMGRVYRAKDNLLGGVPVAIKFLSMSIQNKKMRLRERFEREAKTCALLGQKSIHIVRVMDYGVDENNTPFYVMEYLQGKSLSQIVRKQHLTLPRFISMMRQICLGLQCAHDGIPIDGYPCPIIHRDVKLSNMMVVVDPSFGELVKILDFGIAKLLQSNTHQTNFYLGTLAYSSPEQMEGKELDNRSDIYSLGVLMFEMLTGKLPLVAPTHSFGAWYKIHHYEKPRSFADINPELKVSRSIESLVMNCLAKAPSDRPQKVSEILDILTKSEEVSLSHHEFSLANAKATENLSLVPLKTDLSDVSISAMVAESERQNSLALRGALSREEILKQAIWPKNKPIANIVFPHILNINDSPHPALWIMLPRVEIQKRLVCTRYNQFMFIMNPHPMLLWITVIYNRQHGTKWFPYYLDLKTNFAIEVTRLLSEAGYYRLLLFACEEPNTPEHFLMSTIATDQCRRLQDWLAISYTLSSSGGAQLSKNLLKNEYEKIKPQILAKLGAMNTDSPFDLSA
jgi:eukaryotic-like serine/threonine-protein kinase